MLRTLYILILFVLTFSQATKLAIAQPTDSTQENGQQNSIVNILGDNQEKGYARVTAPREFTFPADHGSHNDYRSEWWYFTGNLQDEVGRKFGYQLTFFRFSLSAFMKPSESAWRTNQIYMVHFAVSDITGDKFYPFERYSRAALDIAGAKPDRLHVWLKDWSVSPTEGVDFPLQLKAAEDQIAIDLRIEQGKPIVLQGDKGMSQKGAEKGNASYYYSLTRMPTQGSIQINDQHYQLNGNSWLDREWSTSALGEHQVGWDWFALQLSDGREVMFYRMRRDDGRSDIHSAGTLIDQEGRPARLDHDAVTIEEKAFWKSPQSGIRYPSNWRLRVPEKGLDLTIEPLLDDQELNHSFNYWEGAVSVRGTSAGEPVSGRGYVELAGYRRQ